MPIADAIGRLYEPLKLGRRVVGGDPTGAMPEQILAILKAHARRPKAAAERVLEVVDPHVRKACAIARADPS